jgi:transcriptional regulator of aromatic amino acid metabolism
MAQRTERLIADGMLVRHQAISLLQHWLRSTPDITPLRADDADEARKLVQRLIALRDTNRLTNRLANRNEQKLT